ncbi:MAG TPA: hypothetical protein VNN18_13215 [Candidatus Xenobia bacterium]|nr:hypothetical protein [Candidatus Xenobia bacterium]
MKTRTVLAALLLLHLLVHPLIHSHALVALSAASPELQPPGDAESNRARAAGPVHCMACRSGASSVATPVASEVIPIPSLSAPLSVASTVRPSSFVSASLPARAPPVS